jgi:hypothetical protein
MRATRSARALVLFVCTAAVVGVTPAAATAEQAQVVGGKTSVSIDWDGLPAGGWHAFDADGMVEGSLSDPTGARFGAGFPVTGGSTATFDTADPLATFVGAIVSSGYLFYFKGYDGVNGQGTFELGEFSLEFDAARIGTLGGLASGFFLRNGRVDGPTVAFDIGNPNVAATTTSFTFSGDLLGSPEFAQFLQPHATPDFVGWTAGQILVEATAQATGGPPPANGIPLPAAFPAALMTMAGLLAPYGFRNLRRRP